MKPQSFREKPKTTGSSLLAGMNKLSNTRDARTANGALTNSTSLNPLVDFFFLAGASRAWKTEDRIKLFQNAFATDPLLAMKLLFWSRDVRGGAGERQFFRDVYSWAMSPNAPHDVKEAFKKNLKVIPEYGRADDLWSMDSLTDEDFATVINIINDELKAENGLVAKWLPRKGLQAKIIREALGMSPKQYRKTIVGLSNTVEQKMSAKNWDGINYSHVPSQAMNKYRKAYYRNDESRFTEFIGAVNKGEKEIKAGTLFPYQLYEAWRKQGAEAGIEAQWNALPDYIGDSTERVIPVCDVSGSMLGFGWGNNKSVVTPMSISVSLGVYISERNKSIFKDAFITFSDLPKLQILKGSVTNRFNQLQRAEWGGSTNIQGVFDLILNSAIKNNVSIQDMPTKILIISDMEFNSCGRNYTNLEVIRAKYANAGYEMPDIIFWNVNGRKGNSPATVDDRGIGLVSGFSPSILKSILQGKIETPQDLMLRTINSDRYSLVEV